jgi:putative transposase
VARANRHFIPGGIWHITHRCHKKEFLLKFAQDRLRFVAWLVEARKRFGVQVLNYTVTSNHVHLLVKDRGDAYNIPSAIQLIAGRTGQEYNQRKHRKGAFWEDRYHATAVESGDHLRRCLIYIDLNMVRAGVVRHPSEWAHGGYHEIQGSRRRNTILALDVLAEAVEAGSLEDLADAHREWIEEALNSGVHQRDEAWTKSIAVGSAEFVLKTRERLGARGKGRDVLTAGDSFILRESQEIYGGNSNTKNRPIAPDNGYFWDFFG